MSHTSIFLKTCFKADFELVCDLSATSYRQIGDQKSETVVSLLLICLYWGATNKLCFGRRHVSDESQTFSCSKLVGNFVADNIQKQWNLGLCKQTRTATRSCWTRKRSFHFYWPGVVRRSHALHRGRCRHRYWCRCSGSRNGAADAAAGAAVYRQVDD